MMVIIGGLNSDGCRRLQRTSCQPRDRLLRKKGDRRSIYKVGYRNTLNGENKEEIGVTRDDEVLAWLLKAMIW